MKTGDLVKWSAKWIAGCSEDTEELYRNQLGIAIERSDTVNCFKVTWSDGQTSSVHYDYLEVI
tara:strand:+ start:478 stop:666 length:189 start_codon:yes stop_codon:yes gene_type:complete